MSDVFHKPINPTFRWEQDGVGGDHGTATFFPETHRQVQLRIESFTEANALAMAINSYAKDVRKWARDGLLSEISRIKP